MKNLIFLSVLLIVCSSLPGNGMLIRDAVVGSYFDLYRCNVDIQINNQAAVTTATMYFHNQINATCQPKFAFPLKDNASATSLHWLINGDWHEAVIAPGQQGGIVPPGQV